MDISLGAAVEWKFPGLITPLANSPIRLQNDGNERGDYIAHWDAEKVGAPKQDEAELIAEYRAAQPDE